jgi:hypothetical protein
MPDLPCVDLRHKLSRLLPVGLHDYVQPYPCFRKSELKKGHIARIVFRNQNIRIARRRPGITIRLEV